MTTTTTLNDDNDVYSESVAARPIFHSFEYTTAL